MDGIQPTDPTYMTVGVLTAALHELTPRERREWLEHECDRVRWSA